MSSETVIPRLTFVRRSLLLFLPILTAGIWAGGWALWAAFNMEQVMVSSPGSLILVGMGGMLATIPGGLLAMCLASRKYDGEISQEGFALIFSLLVMALGVVNLFWDSDFARTVRLNHSAMQAIERAEGILGHKPAIANRVSASVKSWESSVVDREFLMEVATSSADVDSVLNHLSVAQALGEEAVFVTANGMVREKDKRALLDIALRKAAQGDGTAAMFVARLER